MTDLIVLIKVYGIWLATWCNKEYSKLWFGQGLTSFLLFASKFIYKKEVGRRHACRVASCHVWCGLSAWRKPPRKIITVTSSLNEISTDQLGKNMVLVTGEWGSAILPAHSSLLDGYLKTTWTVFLLLSYLFHESLVTNKKVSDTHKSYVFLTNPLPTLLNSLPFFEVYTKSSVFTARIVLNLCNRNGITNVKN